MSHFVKNSTFAGQYTLLECRHEGDVSEIWVAEDLLKGRQCVTLEIFIVHEPLPPALLEDVRAHFVKLISLEHPRLLQPLHCDVISGVPFLVFPYLASGSLRDWQRANNKLMPEAMLLHMIKDVSDALSYLHEQPVSVLHQRLTPEDIFCTTDNHYLLTNYGRSQSMNKMMIQYSGHTGNVVPKQVAFDSANPQATPAGDIFSLGAVAYEMATGLPVSVDENNAIRLKKRPAHISPKVWDMICRCLDVNPSMRPKADEISRWVDWECQFNTLNDSVDLRADRPESKLTSKKLRFILATIVLVFLGLYFALFLYNNNLSTKNSQSHSSSEDAEIILRLHGSNTIGAELAPTLASKFLSTKGAVGIVRVQSGEGEMIIRGSVPGKSRMQAIQIFAHGSSTAFQDLQIETCDIGMSSRRVKDEEVIELKALGNFKSPACEHVIALDGVCIIVNSENNIPQLSIKQLAAIFTGKITSWAELGGINKPINVYARDENSGTWDTFKSLVMGNSDKLVKSAQRFESSEQLRQAVYSDPSGIGFIGLAYTKGTRVLAVGDSARFVLPSPLTIGTEEYPLSRRLFLYTAESPSNPRVLEFVEFALTDSGQEVCSTVGFIGQQLSATPASTGSTIQRLNFSFRFESGSSILDNKAIKDIERLVRLLDQPEYSSRKIRLSGYSDSIGDSAINKRLSQERANSVASILKERGIQVGTVLGYGAADPVASNNTVEGRNRNRRVDVWIE